MQLIMIENDLLWYAAEFRPVAIYGLAPSQYKLLIVCVGKRLVIGDGLPQVPLVLCEGDLPVHSLYYFVVVQLLLD